MSINQYNKMNQFGRSKPLLSNKKQEHNNTNVDNTNYDSYNLYNKLYSPGNTKAILLDIEKENKKGKLHILYNKLQKIYGYNENMVIPYYDNVNKKYTDLVVLNNPDDVENIVEKHVKKSPYLKKVLYDSIISTTSVEHWREQRRDYVQAFSMDNYKEMIKLSNKRTKVCVSNLSEMCLQNNGNIDLYKFFLNETLAQLQLVLLGVSDEFQRESNPKIRKSFRGEDNDYAREYAFSLLDEVKKSKCPLGKAMAERTGPLKSKSEEFGNALIFTFAGHDTTANTLSWLIFELCRNKEYYNRFRDEVDNYWKRKITEKTLEIEYDDFKTLPFITCCIMETLRLWTSIPNGTTRELQSDDYITGRNNEKVKIKKGTYVQIPNWTRHRNPLLWGNDCDKFDPFRNFKDEEIWDNSIFANYNPATKRFSPFTYGPRDCIGKNFSQIEMRIILLNLFKNFDFYIPDCQLKRYKDEDLSFNDFTMGPRNIKNKTLTDKSLAMYINVQPRNEPKSKL